MVPNCPYAERHHAARRGKADSQPRPNAAALAPLPWRTEWCPSCADKADNLTPGVAKQIALALSDMTLAESHHLSAAHESARCPAPIAQDFAIFPADHISIAIGDRFHAAIVGLPEDELEGEN